MTRCGKSPAAFFIDVFGLVLGKSLKLELRIDMMEYDQEYWPLRGVPGEAGRAIRLKRIFPKPDGRALILGIDHLVFSGFVEGANRRDEFLTPEGERLLDGLLATPRTYRSLDFVNKAYGKVMRVDTTGAFLPSMDSDIDSSLVVSSDELVRSGVDGAACFYLANMREKRVADQRAHLLDVASMCRRIGYPLIVEALCLDGNGDTVRHTKEILNVATIASELGADVLKIDAPEAVEDLAEIVSSVEPPVLIRGGAPKENDKVMLREVDAFFRYGASGIVFGRSVFQSRDPVGTIRSLHDVVHGTSLGGVA